jgi:hypothetical protein
MIHLAKRALSWPWLVLVLSLVAQPAQAEAQAPATQAEYEEALSAALTAHARGDYEAARLFMERAHLLEPSARTLRGLGIVAFSQGSYLAAIRHLDAALAAKVRPLSTELRQAVEDLLAQAWANMGRLRVHIEPPGSDFTIDGGAPDFYAPNTLALTPGVHTLVASAQGRVPYSVRLEVLAGSRESLHVVLPAPPPPQVIERVAPAGPTRERNPSDAQHPAYTHAARYTLLGVGSVLVVGGAALWGTGRIRLNNLVDACERRADGGRTEQLAERRYNEKNIQVFATAGGVVFGAGGALLLTLAGVELWRWQKRKTVVRAQLSGTSLGLFGTF